MFLYGGGSCLGSHGKKSICIWCMGCSDTNYKQNSLFIVFALAFNPEHCNNGFCGVTFGSSFASLRANADFKLRGLKGLLNVWSRDMAAFDHTPT